jgi:hypothetical protein
MCQTAVVCQRLTVAPGEIFGWALLREGATASLREDTLHVQTRDGAAIAVAA